MLLIIVLTKCYAQCNLLMDMNQSKTNQGMLNLFNDSIYFPYILFALHSKKFGTLVTEPFKCLKVSQFTCLNI